MAGLLSKNIKLGYKASSSASTYTNIPNLQEIPDVGGAADKVDVTVLADGNYKYISGIKDFGDLEFTFLYDNSGTDSNYRILRGLEESGDVVYWQLEFPDATTAESGHGTQIAFSGQCSTAISGVGVNDAMTFKLTITLNSDLSVTNPT